MENLKREPILLKDDKEGAKRFIQKINALANEAKNLQKVFVEVATENLNITYSREWLSKAVNGGFKDAIGNGLLKFLDTQPKIMRNYIIEEFHKISSRLYAQADSVRVKFEDLQYSSKSEGTENPSELISFDLLPIDKDANFVIDDYYKNLVSSKFVKYISSEKEFAVYDLVQEINVLKAKYPSVFDRSPLGSWSILMRNLEPIELDTLKHFI